MKLLFKIEAFIYFLSGLLLLNVSVYSQNEILPKDFGERSFVHIKKLTELGSRPAGSSNEIKAACYIQSQFNRLGLKSRLEFFEYKSFEIEHLRLKINGISYSPFGLGFTPYREQRLYKGEAIILDAKSDFKNFDNEYAKGKTIITNDYKKHFELLKFQPQLIIYLDSIDFSNFQSHDILNYQLEIKGHYRQMKSPNVIATIGKEENYDDEIIIGAHLDSYRKSPGANDNGSGIGVMLELARYFKSKKSEMNANIKFIAFGAEELGVLGSRQYVSKHAKSLKKCRLVFNIDDIGGSGTGAIETKGGVIQEHPILNDSLSQRLALQPWEGASSYWRSLPESYLMSFINTVNHPSWLVKTIDRAIVDSGYEIKRVKNLGSDQMSFANNGIVSTSIGIPGEDTHTNNDKIENVNKESLVKAGDIVARTIMMVNNVL